MKDNYKTIVLFLVNDDWGEVFAIFPLEETLNTNRSYYDQLFEGYAHIGQHIEISFRYLIDQRPAVQEEYKDLQKELESIGYDLFVLNDPINHLWINFINNDI